MNPNDYETGLNRDERYLLNKIRMKEIEAIESNIQPERSKREDHHLTLDDFSDNPSAQQLAKEMREREKQVMDAVL